jgi:hypothetical protein
MQMHQITSNYVGPQAFLPVVADLYPTTVLSLLENNPNYCNSQQQAVSGISNIAPSHPSLVYYPALPQGREPKTSTW